MKNTTKIALTLCALIAVMFVVGVYCSYSMYDPHITNKDGLKSISDWMFYGIVGLGLSLAFTIDNMDNGS